MQVFVWQYITGTVNRSLIEKLHLGLMLTPTCGKRMLAPIFMKITFKTETEILREVEISQLTDDVQKELETAFDDKPIKKYEITFKEGTVVKQCHRLEDISDKIVSALTITVG